ncbi:solute carrier family 66 member 3-like isoform X2 [Littorina saxatilis]|uniref:solute carrier family 66 member 3-like isoform X2 n=1 Tax=Littorina saxatilis TaxID=31220 RepID=UPI0038B63C10
MRWTLTCITDFINICWTSAGLVYLTYTILLTYQCAKSYPLSTYLEYCFLVPQDVILLALVLHFMGRLSVGALPVFGIYLFVCYALAFRLVPDAVLTTCISLVTPISMSSKLLQIATLLRSKDAGTLSATTWGLATYSTLARSITTVVQTGDMAVLTTFSISFVLNSVMTTLVVFYQSRKTKGD